MQVTQYNLQCVSLVSGPKWDMFSLAMIYNLNHIRVVEFPIADWREFHIKNACRPHNLMLKILPNCQFMALIKMCSRVLNLCRVGLRVGRLGKSAGRSDFGCAYFLNSDLLNHLWGPSRQEKKLFFKSVDIRDKCELCNSKMSRKF